MNHVSYFRTRNDLFHEKHFVNIQNEQGAMSTFKEPYIQSNQSKYQFTLTLYVLN